MLPFPKKKNHLDDGIQMDEGVPVDLATGVVPCEIQTTHGFICFDQLPQQTDSKNLAQYS